MRAGQSPKDKRAVCVALEMEIDMVRRAKREEISAAAKLAVLMWGGHSEEELAEEFSEILSGGKAQFFLK